jgi:hypothetical protein
MAALPQCAATYPIYDPTGAPYADLLVTVEKVIDANGNSIYIGPLTAYTDPSGIFSAKLPQGATAYLSARASGLWNQPGGVPFAVPNAASGQLVPLSAPPGVLAVVPPITLANNVLAMPKADTTHDGYLSASDFAAFSAATTPQGVVSFNARQGNVMPQSGDYSAFFLQLGGGSMTGPITLAADPASAMQAATRQYVDTKFASGVAGVATFNGRTGAVLPIQADYSSFYLGLAGGTLTGALMLAADPTAMLGAATKQYVDTHAGSGGGSAQPRQYYVSAYNASGSKNTYSGSITATSAALTTTTATDFVVNQGILVKGAGVSGANLVTTVTAISGTSITLATAASTTITAVANNLQHDDTVALQSSIDAAFNAGGGVVWFDIGGFYRVNAGFRTDTDAILRIPFNPWTIATGNKAGPPPPNVELRGYNTPVASVLQPPDVRGPIIQSDLIGATSTSSILSSGNYSAGTAIDGNQISLLIEGLTFRTYDNPQLCALDFGTIWNIFLRDVVVDTGISAQGNAAAYGGTLAGGAQPTHTSNFGLRLPRINECTLVNTDNISVSNYYIGVIGSELWKSSSCFIQRCMVGVQTHQEGANYGITGNLLIVQCPTSISIPGSAVAFDCHVEFEMNGSGWFAPVSGHYIYDPGDVATGFIKWTNVGAGSPSGPQPITITGASKMSLVSLHHFGSTILDVATLSFRESGLAVPASFDAADTSGTGYRRVRVPNSASAPPIISNVSAGNLQPTSATITWTTDQNTDSQVVWGTTASYGNTTPATPQDPVPPGLTSHSVPLTGLLANTQYHYAVKSKNSAGTVATSADYTFTTTTVAGPVISAISSGTPGTNTVTITWTTDVAADSQVEWGTTTSYGTLSPATPQDVGGVTPHSVTISTGLSAGVTYDFRVKSKGIASGVLTNSANQSFTTASGSTTLNTNLVSFWKMDALVSGTTVHDQVGTNDLVIVGSNVTIDASGKIGSDIKTTSGGVLQCADAPSQHFSGPFSVAGWLSVNAISGTGISTILSKCDLASNQAWGLWYNEYVGGGTIEFALSANGSARTAASGPGGSIAAGTTWYHLAGTWDGATIKVYLNGSLLNSAAFAGPVFNSTYSLDCLYPTTGASAANCRLDEVGMWSRALSAAEVTQLYNYGNTGQSYPFP